MTVHWTTAALGHLTAIHDYIAKNSPRYALKVIDRITRRSEQFAAFPYSGAKVQEYNDEAIREVGGFQTQTQLGLETGVLKNIAGVLPRVIAKQPFGNGVPSNVVEASYKRGT